MKIIILLLIIGLILISGCSKSNSIDIEFKEFCKQHNGVWMKMEPTINGEPTGESACNGCMLENGDHICNFDKFKELVILQHA